jgi:hypothetical protein
VTAGLWPGPGPAVGRFAVLAAALRAGIATGIPAGLGEALTGLDRAGITAAARAVLHTGGHWGATVTLPGIPPHLRRRSER